jgi:hypothetical protein
MVFFAQPLETVIQGIIPVPEQSVHGLIGPGVAKVGILAKWVLPSRACNQRQSNLRFSHQDTRPP